MRTDEHVINMRKNRDGEEDKRIDHLNIVREIIWPTTDKNQITTSPFPRFPTLNQLLLNINNYRLIFIFHPLLPGQLVRNEVAVRRINRRVLVHAAHESFSTRLVHESQLLEYVLQPLNYRPIKLIVVVWSPSANCYLRLYLIALRGTLPTVNILHLPKRGVRLHVCRGW